MKKSVVILFCFLSATASFAQNWQVVGGGLNRWPTAMYYDSLTAKLYVGGAFTQAGGQNIWGIASWNGTQWDSLGHGIDQHTWGPSYPSATSKIMRYGNYLYICGAFRHAGNIDLAGLARWDGNNWDSVPGGNINAGSVSDMMIYNNEMYITGSFDSVGNVAASCIAKWNGTSWSSIGSNYCFSCTGTLGRMIEYNGELFVGSNIIDNQGNTCRLLKWDGSNWHFLTNTIQGQMAGCGDIVQFQNELYCGGLFFESDGNPGTSIMKGDGVNWGGVGGSFGGISNPYPTNIDMQVHQNKLYCVGNFETAGGVPANSVAIWDGTDWCSLGSTFDNRVTCLGFLNDTLYVGGGFWNIDNQPVSFFAKWTGGNYVDTCGHLTTGINEDETGNNFKIYPNPVTQNVLNIQCNINLKKQYNLKLFDISGRLILEQKIIPTNNEVISFYFDSSLENGMYLIRIENDDGVSYTGKICVQH